MRAEPRLERLTPRESQITALVTIGMQDKAIAEMLKISENTVGFHLKAAYRKRRVNSRTQLIASGRFVVTHPNV